jgi:cation diffusion facilitator family transporter
MSNMSVNHMENSSREKKTVAMLSVIAAVFLTGFKLVVGFLTGSLGILSEALHSGLDLVAAVITWFSVSISDKPADKRHPFGHGKVENFSALAETVLLVITCGWIIYEAVSRLVTGQTHIEVTVWSYIVVVSSIVIDIGRSRSLARAAKKHNSQALEADALHFQTDIWSSSVVLAGLIFAQFGFHLADPIAALGVAAIVLTVSYRLGKRAMDVLLDSSDQSKISEIEQVLKGVHGIRTWHDLRVRVAGADTFVEVTVHLNPDLTLREAHQLTDQIETNIEEAINRAHVHVHAEPDE